ncbi:ATP-dependent DNA helicase [Mycobacterium sp. CVI_P3]|uniref:DNA 3'-5' helicase n=2 Tax=Mycobacterium pinniadriaticum TaxID=2994102 RepID=A0ABT3SG55_9MYCO|nr:ATP-dependent DNA helicase [Mycobacterium pinniadriaticum]MCX2932069.1 ATP-dependent DNA helicase [Mycobacterium pinniadriaticum]MCX2938493.1 ATP-dependent DNA helicase [Mycobacterium pinniadriaticum]
MSTPALVADATEPADVLRPDLRGTVRVVGGPGAGKTSLLVAAAASHIAAGTDPESVLLLTGSGRLAASTRSALTAQLLAARSAQPCRAVVREPLVRSVHSYAFAVLRQAAARAGDPPPRLVTGAEQDGIIRELLAGDLADGDAAASRWPHALRPALTTAGFATELRDLLARCAERGVDPLRLQRIGRLSGRPEWVAAGRFAQQYEQVMLLRAAVGTAAPQATVPALGAAELVGAALEALASDAELLAAERSRVRLLLVDDAQHLDPQAARLVRVLAAGAELTLLAGDPNQAVFGFRGADPALLTGTDTPVVELSRSYRCAPAVAAAISGIAAALPGTTAWRALDGNTGDNGSVQVRLAASAAAEAALVADTLRRAHLLDGVPWSQLAVIVRSPSAAAALPRALAGAGVPVAADRLAGPIADQPAVRALLGVLAATVDGLDGERAVSLLTGPIGRVDPVTLRQLRRTLRRGGPGDFGDQLVAALTRGPVDLTATLARPVNRLRAVLAAAGRGHRRHRDPRYTLWQAWERSGLQRRWLSAAERGGTEGALADRSLEAVTALFDIADDYVSRTTGASLRGLLDHVAGLQLPPVSADRRGSTETVAVLSPHAALDRDWELVVIAGLQDGLWPNTTPRGGVLGTQRLLDALDGLGDDVSARAPLLAEERRLLIAAMGRARSGLLITAVDSDAGDEAALPSPFVAELTAYTTGADTGGAQPAVAPPVLAPAAVVGRLRAVVCAPAGAVTDGERATAARQLARLAADGVAGADPAQWYGMTAVSTLEPLWSGDQHTVTLSPSTLQMLTDCPLRWLAERHGGADRRELRSTLGSVVHALLADSASSAEQLVARLEQLWNTMPFDSPWYADNELDRHRAMLAAFVAWRSASRHELTEIGTEVDVDGVIAAPGEQLPGVRVRGRVDRLERDAQGRLVIVDVKTGKSPVTKDAAQRHAQLGLYQLAVAEGALADGDRPGGGRLVYVAKPNAAGATEREQSALTPDSATQWRQAVQQAAGATAGPQFLARVNDGCAHCPMRAACPAHTAPRTEQP